MSPKSTADECAGRARTSPAVGELSQSRRSAIPDLSAHSAFNFWLQVYRVMQSDTEYKCFSFQQHQWGSQTLYRRTLSSLMDIHDSNQLPCPDSALHCSMLNFLARICAKMPTIALVRPLQDVPSYRLSGVAPGRATCNIAWLPHILYIWNFTCIVRIIIVSSASAIAWLGSFRAPWLIESRRLIETLWFLGFV